MGPITRLSAPEADATIFLVDGEVHVQEVLDEIIRFLTTEPTLLVMWDFAHGSLIGLSATDLQMIVLRGAPYTNVRAGGRTAIVCSTELDFGLCRMFQMFAENSDVPFEIHVFRDASSAAAWLVVE